MLYNLLAIIGVVLMFFIIRYLLNVKYGELILKIVSIGIFVFKTGQYIVLNMMGDITIPVEISSISYFMVPVILTFGIKKLYHIASFFGMLAGLGFYFFYILFGFTLEPYLTLAQVLTGIFCHTYLFTTGFYLFKKYDFSKTKSWTIWAVILGMIAFALSFYSLTVTGITFIYWIINPQFLYIFSSTILNILILLVYYAFLIFAFSMSIKLFYNLNQKYTVTRKEDNFEYAE